MIVFVIVQVQSRCKGADAVQSRCRPRCRGGAEVLGAAKLGARRCKYAEVQQWVADAELVLSECGCRGGAEMKVQR